MQDSVFKGLDGTEYDLSLNFLIVREVDKSDYSAITDTPPRIMKLAESDLKALYYDLATLAAMAFAIVWHKRRLNDPTADVSDATYQQMETAFLTNIDGTNSETLRSALWQALSAFLPLLAGDLLRIQENDLFARQELASHQGEINQFNRDNIQRAIQREIQREFNRVSNNQPGELSSDSLEPLAGVGHTSNG